MRKSTIIELALFRANENVSREELKVVLNGFVDFNAEQEGFISEENYMALDGQILSVAYWTDLASAKSAEAKGNQDPEFGKLFDRFMEKIDPKTLFRGFFEIFNDTLTETSKANIVEFSRFKIKEGVNSEEFQMEMAKLNDFLTKQKGFVSRQIAFAPDGHYLDLAYWTDLDRAKAAFEKADKDPEFSKVLNIFDMGTEFFEYFEILNSTNQ